MEKPIKPTNTVNERREDRIRGQLTIDPTADADRQQGATGRNIKSNPRTGDKVMEPNIHRAQTERRMEGDFRLQNTKQRADNQTLQDDRHMKYDPNAQKGGLDVHARYNICFQPHQRQPTAATISSFSNTRNQLHISEDAVWDKYCAIHICENDATNNREDINGNNADNNSIRRDGMDNKQKQEQTGTQKGNKIPRMELEHRINDAVINHTDEEASDGSINQINAIDTAVVISNRKKRGKADWTNPIYKSLIHTRRSSYHIHEPRNDQPGKDGRMGQPNQVIEKNIDRGRMVYDINQEQQTQKYRNTQDSSKNNNGRIFKEMVSNFANTRGDYAKGIQTVESKDPNIEQKGNNSDFISIGLFLANIATQPFALLEDKDRQYNSMLQLNQRESESRIEKVNRPDPSIHRGIIMGSQVQAHPRSQEHRSGFAIEARSFGRLLNIQISATASAR
ncbi:MAG: hypothetical protein EZS28_040880, partial [Streblomastix strix]